MTPKIAQLIRKLLTKKISDQELDQLNDWFKQKESSYIKMKNSSWLKIKRNMWLRIEKQIVSEYIKEKRILSPGFKPVTSIAAAIMLLLTGYYFCSDSCSLFIGRNILSDYTISTGTGEMKDFYLPDSTYICLNAHSSLSYSKQFNSKKRKVKLDGEAYFKVKRDTTRPFEIFTNRSITRVLGTSFSIHSYPNESYRVGVITGKVEVKLPKIVNADAYYLLPGDQLVCNTDNAAKEITHSNDTKEFTLWKNNVLYFDSTPLSEVVQTLERKYGKQFVFRDPAISQRAFKGTFKETDLDDILYIMEVTMALDIKTQNDCYIINNKN